MDPKSNTERRILLLLFTLYLATIFKLTLFRSPIEEVMERWTYLTVLDKVETANFEPLRTIKLYIRILPQPIAIINLVGNVLCFVPLGLFPPALMTRRRGRFVGTMSLATVTVLFIETTQLMTGIGEFDVDDILLNLLGALLGYLCYRLLQKRPRAGANKK